MKHGRIQTCITALLALFLIAGAAQAGDVRGSQDYPLIGRFEGSTIAYYKMVNFDAYRFITGPVRQEGKVEKGQTVEGRKIRIAYHMPEGTTVVEASRNFEIKMKEAGFETLYQCNAKECGGYAFRYTTEVIGIPYMLVETGNFKYVAAKKSRPEGDIYATLLTSHYSGKTRTQLIVVETKAMENKMVDADKMAKAIAETGSIALYGIYFDTNKASIKPESKPALEEIAKLMKGNPGLKIVVVGHTDNAGALEYNMDLSKRRAEAVAKSLTEEHGIERKRLKAWGVGYLAPVATNKTEEGKAKNRRVELVEE